MAATRVSIGVATWASGAACAGALMPSAKNVSINQLYRRMFIPLCHQIDRLAGAQATDRDRRLAVRVGAIAQLTEKVVTPALPCATGDDTSAVEAGDMFIYALLSRIRCGLHGL